MNLEHFDKVKFIEVYVTTIHLIIIGTITPKFSLKKIATIEDQNIIGDGRRHHEQQCY